MRTIGKASRLTLLAMTLYDASPRGLTTQELAERCGVCQRTIQRDLLDLQGEGFWIPLVEENRRWRLMEGAPPMRLPAVQFELGEAMALFLAARLLSRYADECTPCINSGTRKLASILPPAIGEHVLRTAEAMGGKPTDAQFEAVFDAITRAWAGRRVVHLWYRTADREELSETNLQPYFIEPSGVGYATHVIGHASHAGALRTFKLERIARAELLDETFKPPADFDPTALLGSAWGIMFGDEVQVVTLRFSPAVARRVRESIWHPSQELADEPDGGCRLTVRVAEPKEMRPWIRGWGAECVVLAPAWLREEIGEEMRRAAEGYST